MANGNNSEGLERVLVLEVARVTEVAAIAAARWRGKGQNKAADKFADLPDEELFEDVRMFLNKGAKDGDAPASCG